MKRKNSKEVFLGSRLVHIRTILGLGGHDGHPTTLIFQKKFSNNQSMLEIQ